MRSMLHAGIHLTLRVLDRLLQIVVPPRRRRVCYASLPDYSDNAFYLYRYALTQRQGMEHVWLLHDMDLAPRIRDEFAALQVGQHRLKIYAWHSLAGYWAFLRSACVFHTHGMYAFSNWAFRRFRVGLWHGMPIKCIGRLNTVTPNPKPTFATHYIASSHFFRYVMAAAFAVPAQRVLVSGQPRCDALRSPLARVLQPAQVRQRLGLDEERPLLVWMPTYRAEGRALQSGEPLRSFVDDLPPGLLQAFLQQAQAGQCQILLKLHPLEQADLAPVFAEWPHVRLLNAKAWEQADVQLYDLLAAADGLVSDVSSVLIDFMLTGKAVGVLGFDASSYTRELVFPFDYVASSRQVATLNDAAATQAFYERMQAGAQAGGASGDVAMVLNEHRPELAAEILLQAFCDSALARG